MPFATNSSVIVFRNTDLKSFLLGPVVRIMELVTEVGSKDGARFFCVKNRQKTIIFMKRHRHADKKSANIIMDF